MVYEDREDEFMSMEEQDLYEPDRYDEDLVDTFREQIPGESPDDATTDEAMEAESDMGGPVTSDAAESAAGTTTAVEDGFGESISPDTNPHLDEQLDDQELSDEARRDYMETED